jgi:uncharacterized protein (DUF433 family)
MGALNERYVMDEEGTRVGVILDMDVYQKMLDDLEELESVRAYDAAKASADEAIPFEQHRFIVSDPKVMMGKPVVAGTRIAVELILEKLAAGETVEQSMEAHPRLNREAIQAACGFAAEALRADIIYPLPEAGK